MNSALIELAEAELSKPSLRRDSGKLRSLYNNEREEPRRRNTRFTMWATLALYVMFLPLDFILIPDVAVSVSATRFVLSLFGLILIEQLFRRHVSADLMDAACACLVVSGYLAWLLLASGTENRLSLSYYTVFGTIFMMVSALLFDFRPSTSAVASSIIAAAFFWSMEYLIAAPFSYKAAFGVFYISCFSFNLYVNWKLDQERYNVFLNSLRSSLQQTELIKQSEALIRLSNLDPLTGIANRRSIDAQLRSFWREWQNSGQSFTVFLIDIDFFKNFNDYYGHQEGDRILVLVTEVLGDFVQRHGASIGRYGGEEFIVLASITNLDDVEAFAESLRKAVEAMRIHHESRADAEASVTVSVGASVASRQCGAKLERIVSEADRALYSAKANGRNCVRLFDATDAHVSDAADKVARLLRVAIAEDLVSLVYQPIRHLTRGKITAAEALMRLRMPDGTAVSPAEFVPVAERTGLIHELGRWAIRRACHELLVGTNVPIVSVNISAVQMKAPGFSASVARILTEVGVKPDRLAFEVTEGLDIENQPDVILCIGELQKLGVQIWLDDFGTGFAGLSWLRLIKFDVVKIDRSFLHDSAFPVGAEMLKDIVGLIQKRGPRLVVEGVETQEQIELLRRLQVDQVQGFHIGRPGPAHKLLRDHCELAANEGQPSSPPSVLSSACRNTSPGNCGQSQHHPVTQARTL